MFRLPLPINYYPSVCLHLLQTNGKYFLTTSALPQNYPMLRCLRFLLVLVNHCHFTTPDTRRDLTLLLDCCCGGTVISLPFFPKLKMMSRHSFHRPNTEEINPQRPCGEKGAPWRGLYSPISGLKLQVQQAVIPDYCGKLILPKDEDVSDCVVNFFLMPHSRYIPVAHFIMVATESYTHI